MPLVISDASTLIHLAAIGRLDLLKDFYGRVVIPAVVWREVVEEGKGRAGAAEVERAQRGEWIVVEPVQDTPLRRLLCRDLDEGEAEVVALAVERSADLVLVDESEARRVAERFGLPKTGVIGILVRAKREGRIQSLARELEQLRLQAGFWIEERLCREALAAVGEERVEGEPRPGHIEQGRGPVA